MIAKTALVALVLLAIVATPVVAPTTAISFSMPVNLRDSAGYGEPSIAVGPDGAVYVASPGEHTSMWRSTNGAATFTRLAETLGSSGDSDIALDADGTLYASDLFSNVPVSVSFDRAKTFSYVSTSGTSGSIDRQWLAAAGSGHVYSVWRDGTTERIAISHDQAKTWTRSVIATGVSLQGNIIATTPTDLYWPYTTSGAVRVAISHDAGASWKDVQAMPLVGGSYLFPSLAVDQAGNIFVVASEGGNISTGTDPGNVVRFTRSLNDGATWSLPTTISIPSDYGIFPWIIADAPGRVAVAWLDGVPPLGYKPDTNTAAATPWYVGFAYSNTATAVRPAWQITRATDVIFTGPICTFGIRCSPVHNPIAMNRVLLDFFEMAELPNGNVVIAYPGSLPGTQSQLTMATQLYVVKQSGGPNLK